MFEIERYKKAFDEVHASERTQTEVLRMMEENRRSRRGIKGKRALVLAAAAILVLAMGMAAYAAITWDGFALTGGMSRKSVDQMLADYSAVTVIQLVEPDGTVHYLDKQGKEVMVLTAAEAAEYDRQRRAAKDDAVRGSTVLIDVDTLPVVPNSITELEIGADGTIPDFALGNGHMVLFCPAEEAGCTLADGDSSTLTLTSNDDCFLVYYVFRDGALLTQENDGARMRAHTFSFAAGEPGIYTIGMMYGSADASNFTEGTLTVDRARKG